MAGVKLTEKKRRQIQARINFGKAHQLAKIARAELNEGKNPGPGGENFVPLFPLSNFIPSSSSSSSNVTSTTPTTEEIPIIAVGREPESDESYRSSTTTNTNNIQCLICGGGGAAQAQQLLLVSKIPSSLSSKSIAVALTQLLLRFDGCGGCNEVQKQQGNVLLELLETSWYCRACLEELKDIQAMIGEFEKLNTCFLAKRTQMIQAITSTSIGCSSSSDCRSRSRVRELTTGGDDDENGNVQKNQIQLRNKLIKILVAQDQIINSTKSNVKKKKKMKQNPNNPKSKALLLSKGHDDDDDDDGGQSQTELIVEAGGERCLSPRRRRTPLKYIETTTPPLSSSTPKPTTTYKGSAVKPSRPNILQGSRVVVVGGGGGGARKLVTRGGKKRRERPRKYQIPIEPNMKSSPHHHQFEELKEGEEQQHTSFLEGEEEMEQDSFVITVDEGDEVEEEWEIKDVLVDPLQLESPTIDNMNFCSSSPEAEGFEETKPAAAPPEANNKNNNANQFVLTDTETDFKLIVISCSYCSELFTSQSLLDSHSANHHLLCPPPSSHEKERRKKYSVKNTIRSHITAKAHHSTQNKPKLKPKAAAPTSIFTPKIIKKNNNVIKIKKPAAPQPASGQCSECGQYYQNVKRHQSLSHGMVPPRQLGHPRPTVYGECSVCGKRLSSKMNLRFHMLSQHGKNQGQGQGQSQEEAPPRRTRAWGKCNECGRFVRNLAEHQLSRHATTFTCNSCPGPTSSTFSNYIDYRHHLSSSHPELGLPSIQCPHCHKLYKSTLSLNKHINWMHQHKFISNCPICNKRFRVRQDCDDHVKAKHESIKAYVCHICDGKFGSKKGFASHLGLHAATASAVDDGANGSGGGVKQRKYKCDQCTKSFTQPGKLRDHIDAVHGVNKEAFVCEVCGKGFPIHNYLYIHLRSHETPEEKEARRLKAKAAAEARKLSGKPVLIPKGRPRIRPIKESKKTKVKKSSSVAGL